MLNKAPKFNSSKMLNLVTMPHLHKTDVTCRFLSVGSSKKLVHN